MTFERIFWTFYVCSDKNSCTSLELKLCTLWDHNFIYSDVRKSQYKLFPNYECPFLSIELTKRQVPSIPMPVEIVYNRGILCYLRFTHSVTIIRKNWSKVIIHRSKQKHIFD